MEEDIRRRQRILFVGVVAGIFAIIVAALIYRGMKQSSSGTASKGRVVSAEQEAEQARAAQLKARWEMIRDMRTSFADEPVWIQELAGADSQFCEAVFRWYEIDRFVERELGGAHPGSFGLNAIEVFQLRQDRALGFVRAVVLALRDLRDNKVGPKTACNFLLRERGLTQSPSKREFLEEAIAALRKVGLTPEQLQAGDKGLQTSTEEFRQLLLTAVREETAVLRPKWRNGNKNAAATLRQFLSKYRFSPEEIGLNDWEAKRLQLVHYPN
jgi:hypothetical protein